MVGHIIFILILADIINIMGATGHSAQIKSDQITSAKIYLFTHSFTFCKSIEWSRSTKPSLICSPVNFTSTFYHFRSLKFEIRVVRPIGYIGALLSTYVYLCFKFTYEKLSNIPTFLRFVYSLSKCETGAIYRNGGIAEAPWTFGPLFTMTICQTVTI